LGFPGDGLPAQRPSWNYRKDHGGGIILDMLCHWRYVLDNLFGEVRAVTCRGALFIDRQWDEEGRPYDADAEDGGPQLSNHLCPFRHNPDTVKNHPFFFHQHLHSGGLNRVQHRLAKLR
jgi:hypothetical protein